MKNYKYTKHRMTFLDIQCHTKIFVQKSVKRIYKCNFMTYLFAKVHQYVKQGLEELSSGVRPFLHLSSVPLKVWKLPGFH